MRLKLNNVIYTIVRVEQFDKNSLIFSVYNQDNSLIKFKLIMKDANTIKSINSRLLTDGWINVNHYKDMYNIEWYD